jgi:hypothetical protein
VRVACSTKEEMIRAARRRLAQGPWDDRSGGTESDTSLRRNRVLVDVSSVDRSTGGFR